MRDIQKLKDDFLSGYEFTVVILTSVPDIPKVSGEDIPKDERLHGKDLSKLFWDETIPGILVNAKDEKFELIIVDNGSNEFHKSLILKVPQLHQPTRIVFNNENFGVASGWNSGLKLARGQYICIVSDDFIVGTPNFLRILQKPMLENSHVVVTGPETAQLGNDAMSRQLWRLPYVDYSAVNCCMFNHRFLKKVGYLDKNYFPYLFEDSDIGFTVNAHGFLVQKVDLPGSLHWGSSTVYRYWTGKEVDEICRINKEYLLNKHRKYLEQRLKEDSRYA